MSEYWRKVERRFKAHPWVAELTVINSGVVIASLIGRFYLGGATVRSVLITLLACLLVFAFFLFETSEVLFIQMIVLAAMAMVWTCPL